MKLFFYIFFLSSIRFVRSDWLNVRFSSTGSSNSDLMGPSTLPSVNWTTTVPARYNLHANLLHTTIDKNGKPAEFLLSSVYPFDIICMNAITGVIEWTQRLPQTYYVIWNKNWLITIFQEFMIIINIETGEILKNTRILITSQKAVFLTAQDKLVIMLNNEIRVFSIVEALNGPILAFLFSLKPQSSPNFAGGPTGVLSQDGTKLFTVMSDLGYSSRLYSYDIATGAELWTSSFNYDFSFQNQFDSYLSTFNNDIFVIFGVTFSSKYWNLMRLSQISGSALWAFNETDSKPNVVAPVINQKLGQVIISDELGNIYSVHVSNGRLAWRQRTSGQMSDGSISTDSGGIVYISSYFDINLYALDGASGKVLWSTQTKNHFHTSCIVGSGSVFVGGYDQGLINSFEFTVQRFSVSELTSTPPLPQRNCLFL